MGNFTNTTTKTTQTAMDIRVVTHAVTTVIDKTNE